MAVKVLLKLEGDATGATGAVDDAEASLSSLGSGVDWNGIGQSLARKAGPMVKAGLIGAALAVGDWLAEGLSEKLATPEGAEAQGALDELTTTLDTLRDSVLTPLLPLIPRVVDLLIPLIGHVSNLVKDLLPPLLTALDLLVGALELASGAITTVLEGVGKLVDALVESVQKVQKFLQDVQKAISDAIDGIATFFANIKKGIDDLLKPIQDAIKPVTDLLDSLLGKAAAAKPPGAGNSAGINMAPGGMSRGIGLGRGSVVNVYTGADPRSVVAALRRYTGDNGDPGGLIRSFRGA